LKITWPLFFRTRCTIATFGNKLPECRNNVPALSWYPDSDCIRRRINDHHHIQSTQYQGHPVFRFKVNTTLFSCSIEVPSHRSFTAVHRACECHCDTAEKVFLREKNKNRRAKQKRSSLSYMLMIIPLMIIPLKLYADVRTCEWLKRAGTEDRRLRDSAVYWERGHSCSRRQNSRRRSSSSSMERA